MQREMTVEELELNEAVARKLGKSYEFYEHCKGDKSSTICICGEGLCPAYSTSIEAAFELIDKLPYFVMGKDKNKWVVVDGWDNDYSKELGKADTAPLAICKAFLKLEGK